jgi:hypothetical protein
MGIPAGKFFRRGDQNGELKPDNEFPIAIPTNGSSRGICWCGGLTRGYTIHVQWAVPGRPGPGTAWPGTMDSSPSPARFDIVPGRAGPRAG